MPHFGLMKTEESFKTEQGALRRARLHVRAGRRRLRQGKISAGVLTLYDAMMFALFWYVAAPERRKGLLIREGDDLNDDRVIYDILLRSGVLDGFFDRGAFDQLVEEALEQDLADYDYQAMLESFEAIMTRLGVMPFDENELPPEDPSTF